MVNQEARQILKQYSASRKDNDPKLLPWPKLMKENYGIIRERKQNLKSHLKC
jgi:hypothetical protein